MRDIIKDLVGQIAQVKILSHNLITSMLYLNCLYGHKEDRKAKMDRTLINLKVHETKIWKRPFKCQGKDHFCVTRPGGKQLYGHDRLYLDYGRHYLRYGQPCSLVDHSYYEMLSWELDRLWWHTNSVNKSSLIYFKLLNLK